jgi:EpsD family peptidyl-prolyl cis-trans isomerase
MGSRVDPRGFVMPVLVALLSLAPAGCDNAQRADAAQIAAKVNGSAISVQQVSGAAARGRTSAETKQAAVQALDRIIDRELLVQKALEAKLDRDPVVAQAIENARRQLLAQAYLERNASGTTKSTPEEIRAFYADNPALFAQRRIYRLREIVIPAPVERLDLLQAEAAQAKELDDVAAWLHSRGMKFTVTSSTQPAEQLPLTHLPQLARMKDGEIAVLGVAMGGASVIQLVHAQEAGLTEPQAAPLIDQFLAGRKRLELAAAEVKRLRQVASIEYVGEFKRN